MDPEILRMLLNEFPGERDEFTSHLKGFAMFNERGENTNNMRMVLLETSLTISSWPQLMDNSDPEHKCFQMKCENIASQIHQVVDRLGPSEVPLYLRRMIYMIALNIGRLTLRRWRDEEQNVEDNARLTEILQLYWEGKNTSTDSAKDTIMRQYWEKLYISDPDCTCRQCMGGFRMAVLDEGQRNPQHQEIRDIFR